MSARTRSTAVLAAVSAVVLTSAAWLTVGAALATPTPSPGDTAAPTATPEPTVEPTSAPVQPDAQPAPPLEGAPVDAAGTTSGNSFAHPVTLTSPAYWPSVTFDSTTATVESHEPRKLYGSKYLQRTMWAKWKAPLSGTVAVQVSAVPEADTGVNVYTGTSLSHLTRVAFNDDQFFPASASGTLGGTPAPTAVVLSLKVTAGKTYYIQAGTPQPDSSSTPSVPGYSTLAVSILGGRYVLPNDDLSAASTLSFVPGSNATNTLTAVMNGATLEEWEPTDNHINPSEPRTGSVWYKWTPTQFATGFFTTCNLNQRESVAVFTSTVNGSGAGAGDLSQVAFDSGGNDGCLAPGFGKGALAVFTALTGNTYYIQVSNVSAVFKPRTTTATLRSEFFHPYIDNLSKTSGPLAGGSTITITGQSFTSVDLPTVKFGTKAATIIGIPTATSIVVKVPKGVHKGKVSVVVTNGAWSSPGFGYTYK